MTFLVYAVPGPVTNLPAPPSYWGLSVTWYGVDGSEWDLSDWTSGVALLVEGFEGLHWPSFAADILQADGVDGQIVTGVKALPRTVSARIGVMADTANQWAELDQRWWKSWHPRKRGRLVVSSQRGSRSIELRLNPGDGFSYPKDPNTRGLAIYQLEAVADQPLWAGDPIVRTWQAVDVLPFLDPEGSPPFHITPRNLVDTAELTNPGDVDVWPVWQVTAQGGVVELTITCAGGTIGLPTVASGDTVVIDTDRINGGADRGVLVDGELTEVLQIDADINPRQYRRVPAGQTVPIGLTLDGPGRVTASLTPLHWRGLP